MKVKAVYVYILVALCWRSIFHHVILQGSCVSYIKRGDSIFKSSWKSLHLLNIFKFLIFPSARPISLSPVSCSSLCNHVSKEKDNKVHMWLKRNEWRTSTISCPDKIHSNRDLLGSSRSKRLKYPSAPLSILFLYFSWVATLEPPQICINSIIIPMDTIAARLLPVHTPVLTKGQGFSLGRKGEVKLFPQANILYQERWSKLFPWANNLYQ